MLEVVMTLAAILGVILGAIAGRKLGEFIYKKYTHKFFKKKGDGK